MSVLDEILVGVRADMEQRQRAMPLDELKLKASKRGHCHRRRCCSQVRNRDGHRRSQAVESVAR